jgi:hypothetical protein
LPAIANYCKWANVRRIWARGLVDHAPEEELMEENAKFKQLSDTQQQLIVAASGNHIASHRTASFVNSVADISYHSC